MNLADQIKLQEEDVENYRRLLDKYGRGRWYWQYRRELDERISKLDELRAQLERNTDNGQDGMGTTMLG